MEKQVIKFFKRNSEAKLCHLVGLTVFAEGERAAADKNAKSRNATVRTIMREECAKWLVEDAPKEVG